MWKYVSLNDDVSTDYKYLALKIMSIGLRSVLRGPIRAEILKHLARSFASTVSAPASRESGSVTLS